MEYSKEFINAIAHGDKEATETLRSLPLTMRMGVAMEVDKIRQEQGIVPQNAGFSVYEQKPMQDRDEAVAESIRKSLEQKRKNEEERRKRHEAYVEKQVKSAIERSRLGLPAQPTLLKTLNNKGL